MILPPAHPDLSLVSLDDLIAEIKRRSSSAAICLHLDNERPSSLCTRSGNYFTVLGLLESYKNDLLHHDLKNMPEDI